MADFAISKPKPKPSKPAQKPKNKPNRPSRTDVVETPEAPPPIPTGIDPALMQEVVTEAKYKATLTRDDQARTALIQATDGKSGWSVNFTDCVEESRCGTMEFYILWKVTNEANVCKVWAADVAQDPTRTAGKPYCYTVPTLPKQFHLKLSSEQQPYNGLNKLEREQAKEQMQGMIGVWATALPKLSEAWKIASKKCPRATDRCV
jgi:hypothetical protein